MGEWETDDEYLSGPAAVSLPTPQDTPYRTPSRTSKRSRRSLTPSGKSVSPPPMPNDRADKGSKRSSRDVAKDESISILDPRRFTPTLHANLVSEILALRREQDDKIRIIESLESTLQITKDEHDSLKTNLAASTKETRSLKRQLALLEGGTSSALSELVKERDDAVESISDTKSRLDSAQKKIRQQEEESKRVHDLWGREKDEWEEERRKFERKVHIAESRLKVVLDEVAAFHASHESGGQQGGHQSHESEPEDSSRENDAASVRTMSITNSVRFSLLNTPGLMRPDGHSLADELNFDDEDDDHTDADGRESALSYHSGYRHTRNFSRDSLASRIHRRNPSSDSLMRPGSVIRGKIQSLLETVDGEDEESTFVEQVAVEAPKPAYVDTGIQFSPPNSPKITAVKPDTPAPALPLEKPLGAESPPRGDLEIEANQRRKRVQPSRPLIIEPRAVTNKMVSAGSQTLMEPLSPPRTPHSPQELISTLPENPKPAMVSSSTQTVDVTLVQRHLVPPAPTLPPPPIPTISIQPPTSRPSTPREPRLPQHFKHFGCQVNLSIAAETSDVAVQTEGIQTDKRLALLPTHLQPSTITSRPGSPNVQPSTGFDPDFTPVPGQVPPRNPRRLTGRQNIENPPSSPIAATIAESETHDVYPGNNDNGPLSTDKSAPMRRPHRFSSLFAGFDTASSDDGDEFGDADLSDSEYRTALSAPRPPSVTPGQRSSTGTVPTSPDEAVPRTMKVLTKPMVKPIITDLHNTSATDRGIDAWKQPSKSGKAPEKPMSPVGSAVNRASVMRKAAIIQNGMATHQARSRSPSLGDVRNPPFPIPTRASSRRPPFTSSAPSDGQRSPTRIDGWHRRNQGANTYRSNSIRKVRSAAALPRNHRYRRHGSRSPPPLSPSTEAPESPGLPRLPRADVPSLRNQDSRSSHYTRHRHQLSTTTNNTYNTHNTVITDPQSQTGTSQTTGVVDAIAQTMIGEWMFKYVRRRTSFGVSENSGKDDNNDRHKRWVWLAPYERAILWSSKQPSSGSALMGKTGRKLTIQSVLDVKDDNPAPKGAGPVFNRSILILTPERALKFTATSAERHYIWLTALSFLAHSSQSVPDIMSPQPPVAQLHVPDFEPQQPKLKRGGIRDSIRLAKNRPTGLAKAGVPSVPSVPSALSSQPGDGASFQIPETIGNITSSHIRDDSRDAAEPPFIPRFQDRANHVMVHGRKRSNTGGHVPPPLSFRGFSGPASNASSHHATNSTAGTSVGTAGSSDIYQSQASSNLTWGMSQAGSQRTSEASSRPSNFFDAIGTVRMEAFISPLAYSQFQECPEEQDEMRQEYRRRSKEIRRRRSRSRHRGSGHATRSNRATDDYYGGSRAPAENDFFREDPFKGF
ncbi:Anucleate primary sterigmata protein A [Paramyrothecium foliicola]|nr:Anucleate primary sterigmata protein A [Paramyrothecium foliicola]